MNYYRVGSLIKKIKSRTRNLDFNSLSRLKLRKEAISPPESTGIWLNGTLILKHKSLELFSTTLNVFKLIKYDNH